MRRPGGRTAITSARVFDAVITLLVDEGYHGVTFQAVAERAKVGRATLYRRWGDVGGLIVEAVRARAAEQIVGRDTGSLKGDLKGVLQQVARFISSPVGHAALLASLATQSRADGAAPHGLYWAARWRDIAPIFERAKARGELEPNADTETLFAQMSGALYFRLLVIASPPDDAWIERIINHGI